MSQTEQRVVIRADFNASEAVSEIQKLSLANKNLNAELEQVNTKTKEGKALKRQLKEQLSANRAELDKYYKALGNEGLNMNELRSKIANLTNQYKHLVPAAADYAEQERSLRERILETTAALNDRNNAIRSTSSAMTSTQSSAPESMFGAIGAKVAGGIAIAMGAKEVLMEIANVGNEYKKLDVVLDASLEHNKVKFAESKKIIRSFSDDFGVNLGEVTESFVRMTNLGITPTRKSLTQVSDFAIANKKTIQDYVEAIADAQTGENERLKEFGIKSAKNGNIITYTYKGIATQVKNNAEAINEYLLGLGSLNSIAGTTAELGKGAAAQWVKFMNVVKDIAFAVFNFFEPAIAGAIQGLTKFATGIADVFDKTGSLTRKYEEQKNAVADLATNTEPLLKRYDELKSKSNLSKIEQTELNAIIGTLAKNLPSTTLQFDNLGNAIGVSTDKARNFIKMQKAMLKAQNAELILDVSGDLKKAEEELKHLQRLAEGNMIQDKKGNNLFQQTKAGFSQGLKAGLHDAFSDFGGPILNANQFSKLQSSITETKAKADELKLAIQGLSGENLDNPEITKPETKKTTDTKTPPTAGEENKAKKLAEKRLENHAKVLMEQLRMETEMMADEDEKKRKQLQIHFDEEMNSRKKLVLAKEMNQSDLDIWEKTARAKLNDELNKLDQERKKKQDKIDGDYHQKVQETALKSAKLVADTNLKNARASGDEEAILSAELAVNIVEERLAILKAGEIDHSEIHAKFEADRAEISAKFAKKAEEEKAKIQKGYSDARDADDKRQLKLKEDKEQKLAEAKRQFAQKAAQEVENAVFGFIKNGIDKETSEEDRKYQRLTQLNDQRLANDEISQAEHDANAVKLQEKHDAKIRELKRKQAIFDKAKAILDIGIATASGVVKAAAGIVTAPMIPWIIATGAIEAAFVAAQPIPEFESGIDDTGDGKKYMQANDGKGGFYAILHPNEGVVNAEDLPKYKAWKSSLSGNTSTPNLQYPNVTPLIIQMNQGRNRTWEKASSGAIGVSSQTVNNTNIPPEILGILIQVSGLITELKDQMKVPVPVNLKIGHKAAEDLYDTAMEAKEIKTKSSAIS